LGLSPLLSYFFFFYTAGYLFKLETHNHILEMRKGQTLINAFIGIMLAAVIGGAVAIPVINNSLGIETTTVANETINSSGTLSENISVSDAPEGVVSDSETIYIRNETGGETAQLAESDYRAFYDAATFNINSLPGTFESSLDSNDQYLVSYEGKPNNYVESNTARTILGFVALGIAVSIFLASLSPIRGSGKSKTKRA